MDRRTLLAVTLCFLIFMAWQKLYLEPRTPAPQAPSAKSAPVAQAPQALEKPAVPPAPVQSRPGETRQLPLSTGIARAGDGNRIFTGWDLKSYKLTLAPEAAAVDLKSVTNQEGVGELGFDSQEYAYLSGVQGTFSTSTSGGVLWTYEDAQVVITRELRSTGEQAWVDVTLTATFKGKRPNFAFVSLNSQGMKDDSEAMDRQLVYFTGGSIEREQVEEGMKLRQVPTSVKWIGATSRYFMMSLVSTGELDPRGLVQPVGTHSGRVSLVFPVSGDTIRIPLKAYFGPKELDILRSVDATLDHAVDFGWFTVFAYPLLRLMKWFHALFGNWGVSIILLTLLVKILTYPLTYKSMKSMKQMAKLQPQLQKLREKHADDREALNREMLTMMRSHGYNPMAGCLPILIQMPVFFALYRVLYSSIELFHAPFILWIHDLSAKDPYYVTPVLLTLTMYVQQKLTPHTATDPMQQKMLQFMPVIFGVFMLTLPSGLTVYMLVNALASIVQQLILNKKLDMGHVPATPARAR